MKKKRKKKNIKQILKQNMKDINIKSDQKNIMNKKEKNIWMI